MDNLPRTLTAWRLSSNQYELGNSGINIGNTDAPKTKFLYTVSFDFNSELKINAGDEDMSRNAYPCKSVTRPTININYADVNSYNYRYKVATRTDVGTVTISFYDDNKNTAHRLLSNYLKMVSPIARKRSGDSYYLNDSPLQDWASLGPLPTRWANGLIRTMRVTHHYNSGLRDDETFYNRIHYDYINPKIQMFNWDELDMGASDAPMISATFVFDSVNIVDERVLTEPDVGMVRDYDNARLVYGPTA